MTAVIGRGGRTGYQASMQIGGLNDALATSLDGLRRTSTDVAKVAQSVAENGVQDLDRNLITLVTLKTAFKANAAVARTADEMSRSLIDILA